MLQAQALAKHLDRLQAVFSTSILVSIKRKTTMQCLFLAMRSCIYH